MYGKGQGVPQDYKEAVRWYRKAANQGLALAQYNLGVMYLLGQGVPQNFVVAYALFNLAATTNQKAYQDRALVSKKMTPSQIEAGQRLTTELMKPGNFLNALDAATGGHAPKR